MPIISSSDLSTHIYPEVLEEIVRNDDTIINRAIDAAIQEAKMYLSRYDLVQLFGAADTAPQVQDEYLKNLVKDIACWHLIRLSNASVDYAVYRTAYEDALCALRAIMHGDMNPQGWPYYDATTETTPDGDTIAWYSNPKRVNYY